MKSIALLLLSFLLILISKAQEVKPPYWNEIQNFKNIDSLQKPSSDAILFVGSSSFTNWKNVQEMFPEYKVINRGFGGSKLPDIKLFFDQVKYPDGLKQIVIYAGDNDIAGGADAKEVLTRFETVFNTIRKDLPKVPVAFIAIKPCPGRAKFIPIVKEANQLVKNFIKKQSGGEFIDIYTPMLDNSGQPIAEIFLEDGVHMNQKGYEIWVTAIKPKLKK